MSTLKVNIPVEYSDLFDDHIPLPETILSSIPSSQVIKTLSFINGHLFRDSIGITTQNKLLQLFIKHLAVKERTLIYQRIKTKVDRIKDATVIIFSQVAILEFIHRELIAYRDLPEIELSPSQELNIFKTYLVIASEINEDYKTSMPSKLEYNEHYFERVTWPSLLDQFEFNRHLDILPGFVRGQLLLKHFGEITNYKRYLEDFLTQNHAKEAFEYGARIILLLQSRIDESRDDIDLRMAFIVRDSDSTSFLDQFILDKEIYKQDYSSSKKRYNGIKEYPIVSLNENLLVILNWSFLINKLYEGLVYDFYKRSGISNKFKDFLSFKRYVSTEVTEKTLFRKIVNHIFRKKHSIIQYDNQTPLFPDAYVRMGNKLFLFELKDAYFQGIAAESLNFNKIKEEVNRKLNSPSKGTGQLIKQLQYLTTSNFGADTGYKTRNLYIIPIVVYTDPNFGMPGINRVLKENFDQELIRHNMNNHFAKIIPLTLLSIEFLIQEILHLSNSVDVFHDTLKDYHTRIEKRKKRFLSQRSESTYFAVQSSFEQDYSMTSRESESIQIYKEIFDLGD